MTGTYRGRERIVVPVRGGPGPSFFTSEVNKCLPMRGGEEQNATT